MADQSDLYAQPLECLETSTGDNPVGTVIWMHGLGADATDFEPIVPMLELHKPLRFVFPNAPVRPITINGGMEMRGWYDIDPGAPLAGDADIQQAAAAISRIISHEQEQGIQAADICLAGFSQGGVTQDVWGFATDTALTPGVQYEKVAGDNNGDSLYVDFICFARDTLIRTPNGSVPVQEIRPGDKVWTADDPEAVVQWVGSKTVFATGRAAPVVFETGAIGNTSPLTVSQQHRIFLRSAQASLMFGAEEVLAPAHSLLALDGVRLAEGATVTYHHILFDSHKIVESNGVLTESFFPGETALDTLDDAARDELLGLFPELAESAGYAQPAAHMLKPYEAEALVAAIR